MTRLSSVLVVLAALLPAQAPPEEPAPKPVEFVCPMDPDVRSKLPGKCSKCGMALEAGIPTLIEYPLKVKTAPRALRPGRAASIEFQVLDPKDGKRVDQFNVVHEKLFHLFVVSQDLEYFAHEHPQLGPDGIFRFRTVLPRGGAYRLLTDFYPQGGTPQMIARTIVAGGDGAMEIPKLAADLSVKRGENVAVALETEPTQPLAGKKTLLFFRLDPGDGLEPYLGAWGHLLAASDDLIDLIHAHPAIADGGPQVQFNVFFPREAVYRIWVQLQRRGKVNTVAFTVPVTQLR